MIDWIRIDELRDEVGQDDFGDIVGVFFEEVQDCLLYTSPSPRDVEESRMPSSA